MEGVHGRAGFVEFGDGVEGTGGQRARGDLRGLFRLAFHFVVVSSGDHVPGADLTPFGDGHFLDHEELGFGLRLEFEGETGEEPVEIGAGFPGDQDGVGEEAVAGRVARTGGFAFLGDGASGERAVDAGCFDLCVGTLCTHVGRLILPDQEIRTRFGKRRS